MASSPITSWQIDGETMETMTDFIFLGSKITADDDCSHEIKMLAPWKKSYDQPRQHIKKQRHYFANKGPPSQSYGFSSSHVWMWELDHKEGWAPKNWCFWTVVWEKTVPWTARRLNQSILKEVSPECSLEGLMLKLKLQYFGHLMQRTSWKRPCCWERLKTGGEGDDRGWDGWIASPTRDHVFEQAPGVGDGQGSLACCRPWGSQRVRHDWVTELNWRDFYLDYIKNYYTLLLLKN